MSEHRATSSRNARATSSESAVDDQDEKLDPAEIIEADIEKDALEAVWD
jgi:hypothetical protein